MKIENKKEETILFELSEDLSDDLNQFDIEIRFGEAVLDGKYHVTEWKKVINNPTQIITLSSPLD